MLDFFKVFLGDIRWTSLIALEKEALMLGSNNAIGIVLLKVLTASVHDGV